MNELPLPRLLEQLITLGRWPRTSAEASRQHSAPRVAVERIRALAPEEDNLYLDAPPFPTVRQAFATNRFWGDAMADPAGIDFDRTIVIGDFGLGSDAPIVLDYRLDPTNPRVLRLRWSERGSINNRWIVAAPDFAAFVAILGL